MPANIQKIAKTIWFIIGLLISAAPAHAASIVNLTDKPMQLERETSDGFVPMEIKPNGHYFIPGKQKFRFNGRDVYIEMQEEYALWPDGSFGPQRRLKAYYGL